MSGIVRGLIAASVAAMAGLVLIEMPGAFETMRSYKKYAKEQLQEHPEGDFELGLKIFPDLDGPPPPLALEQDAKLADSLGLDAVSIVVGARGARLSSLDSIAGTVDVRRADSVRIIIALGYPQTRLASFASPRRNTREGGSPTLTGFHDDCVRIFSFPRSSHTPRGREPSAYRSRSTGSTI